MKIVLAYACAALIVPSLVTSPSAVEAQTTYTATASIAALKAYGSSSSTVAHAHVVAYYSNGTTGGGDFDWAGTCPGTANNGTWVAATGVSPGCWVREVSRGLTPEMFGAKGTIPPLTNCTIASGSAVVTCSGHTFTSGDVGDLASFYQAGATHSGGRNWTLNSTIVSVSGSTATLAANASNTVPSPLKGVTEGVFAFGPDDTAAMNAALASNGPTTAFVLSAPAYMITSTFNIGNNSPTWTHTIATVGNPTIICAITNHTDDCVDRQSYNTGSGYFTSFITGGITFDNMNNGLEGFNDKGGYNVYQENVSIKRSYRDCWARTVSDSTLIQQYTAVNTSLFECGLHGILNWTSDNQIYNGSIDELMHIGLDIEGWGYNSGQFGVTGDQRGAAIYSVNTGSAGQNYILGHTFLGPVEINSNRAQAVLYGTDQNPNAIFFADGQQPNTVFGGCIAAPCSNAIGSSFKRWYFESPTIECSGGCSTSSGATFAFQTTRLTPNAMRFQDLVISGNWKFITSNISFGTDCSASGNGCGNFLSQANNGTPSQSLGYNLVAPAIAASGAITAGGAVTGSDLAYDQTLRSSVAPIRVPFATPTDITSHFGRVHNWVEVSGECGGANFDDLVPWQYFGKTPITQALKGDVYGTAPSRSYTINPGTGYVSLTTSVVNASCSVHVSPFGGH